MEERGGGEGGGGGLQEEVQVSTGKVSNKKYIEKNQIKIKKKGQQPQLQ